MKRCSAIALLLLLNTLTISSQVQGSPQFHEIQETVNDLEDGMAKEVSKICKMEFWGLKFCDDPVYEAAEEGASRLRHVTIFPNGNNGPW